MLTLAAGEAERGDRRAAVVEEPAPVGLIRPRLRDDPRTVVRADLRLVGLDERIEGRWIDVALLDQDGLERPDPPLGVGQMGAVILVDVRHRISMTRGLASCELALTQREFDLLLFLARNPARVFTREQLMDQVWRFTYYSDTSTVTVHIRRLRAKIERDPARPRHIETVWGVGYRFAP